MKSIQQIIKEEIQNSIINNEGVGDVYAQKKFGITNPDDEFERQYQQQQKTQTREEIIAYGENYGNVYKNPKSLKNFEPHVRAVSDKNGNIYVAQLDYEGYHDMISDSVDEFQGSVYDSANNITWHRIGISNMFGFSVSFIEYYKHSLRDDNTKKIMFDRIKTVNDNNPTLVLMPFYWSYLVEYEVDETNLKHFLEAFNKSSVLQGYY